MDPTHLDMETIDIYRSLSHFSVSKSLHLAGKQGHAYLVTHTFHLAPPVTNGISFHFLSPIHSLVGQFIKHLYISNAAGSRWTSECFLWGGVLLVAPHTPAFTELPTETLLDGITSESFMPTHVFANICE